MNDISPHSARTFNNAAQLWQRAQAFDNEIAKQKREHLVLQDAGAKASVESHKLLQKQLAEQTEINQRLEHEFKMGAREAVITRRIAYWSLVIGIVSLIATVIAWLKK